METNIAIDSELTEFEPKLRYFKTMETSTEIRSVKNPVMTLITKEQMAKLLIAGYDNEIPILKLFMGPVTWLVTCIDDGILYGYGDVGMGCVEWGGLTSIEELPSIRYRFGYMERDRFFKPDKSKNFSFYTSKESLIGI